MTELYRHNCSDGNYTSWNSTLLDGILADFQAAVGHHTVAMQLSTIPSWMFTDGTDPSTLAEDPWSYVALGARSPFVAGFSLSPIIFSHPLLPSLAPSPPHRPFPHTLLRPPAHAPSPPWLVSSSLSSLASPVRRVCRVRLGS